MKKLCTLLILSAAFAFGQISMGIRIGPPPSPRVVRVLPPSPGPDSRRYRATGMQLETITSGTSDIGLARLIRRHGG